jgi:hypothetical protein
MTQELSRLIKENDGTSWDHSVNHQRCFCHVVAIILGAGLTAIKLSTSEGPTTKQPKTFTSLDSIDENGEMINDGIDYSDTEEEIDPDNVSGSDSGTDDVEKSCVDSNTTKGGYATSGIGFTLKKVSHLSV